MRLVLNASVAINQKYKNWKQHQEMYNHKKNIINLVVFQRL